MADELADTRAALESIVPLVEKTLRRIFCSWIIGGVFAAAVIAALVFDAAERNRTTAAIKVRKEAGIANCVQNRTDQRQGLVAVANVLVDTAKSSPDNQDPGRQAEIEAHRETLIRKFLAGSSDPEDCE